MSSQDSPGPRPAPVRALKLLLALNLVLLGVNLMLSGPASLRGCRPAAAPQSSAPGSPLALVAAEQVQWTPGGDATLRLRFSAAVRCDDVLPALNVSQDGRRLAVSAVGLHTPGMELRVRVAGVHGTLGVRLAPGVLPDGSKDPRAASVTAKPLEVHLTASIDLVRMLGESPPDGSGSILVSFTQPPDLAGLAAYIRIEPSVAFTVESLPGWWGEPASVRLLGAFQPGAIYRVVLRGGLPGPGTCRLSATIERRVQMPDRAPSLRFAEPGRYLAARGARSIEGLSVNVPRVESILSAVYPNNLVRLALRETGREQAQDPEGEWYRFRDEPADHVSGLGPCLGRQELALPDRPNAQQSFRIPLEGFGTNPPPGTYCLTLAGGDRTASRLLVLSDLGLAVRVGRRTALAWVSDLRSGDPVAGAAVTVYSIENQALATGRTGPDGTVAIDLPDEGADSVLVSAGRGGDLTFVVLDDSCRVAYDAAGGNRAYVDGAYEALVTSDRGIYRPGETVHAGIVVRDGRLAAPEPFPVSARVVPPSGRAMVERTLLLDGAGAAWLDVPLSTGAPVGRYEVEVRTPAAADPVGARTFHVEEFVPPRLAVAIDGVAELQKAIPLEARVRASHTFGRPAEGLPARVTAVCEAAPFAPSAWPGYAFGDSERAFERRTVDFGESALDSNGCRTVTFAPPTNSLPPARLRLTLRAAVRDGSGRTVAAEAGGLLDAYEWYIGLRSEEGAGAWPVDVARRVAVVLADGAGEMAAADADLVLSVWRVNWNTVLRRDEASRRYVYESARTLAAVQEGTAVKVRRGRGEAVLALPSAGDYVIRVARRDGPEASSLRVHACLPGDAWVDWGQTEADAVRLSLDRTSYRTGDVARLLVRSPFAGRALLTVENREVIACRTFNLTGMVSEIEVPVEGSFLPHARCVVTVVRPAAPETPWRAHRAAGAIGLPLDLPERRLAVTCEAPAQMRPQSRLTARVSVRDAAGRAASGIRLTLAAVDEAILRLTGERTPDPVAWFLAPRLAAVSGYDGYNLLVPVEEGAAVRPATAPGGDGVAVAAEFGQRLSPVRGNRFRPVALWSGTVSCGADGAAEVGLDVPEFAGRLRLVVLACAPAGLGAAEAAVQVSRPVVLASGLPRFLAPGDRSRWTLECFNRTAAETAVELELTVSGPVRLAGEPLRRLRLPAGGAGTVAAAIEATGRIGVARLSATVRAAGESFTDETELPVRPASGRVRRTAAGIVEPGRSCTPSVSEGFVPGTVRAVLRASAAGEVRLTGALESLLSYPYGCIEQTVSRAFPLLYLADLASLAQPGTLGREEAAACVRVALGRIAEMQQSNGSFGMWGRDNPWPWGTVYAAHFLVEAARAGYEVPEAARRGALDAAARLLDTQPAIGLEVETAAWREDAGLRAYACHVLALAGRAPHGWIARLEEQADLLDGTGRAHLAAACLAAGRPRSARSLLERSGLGEGSGRRSARPGARVEETALLLAAWSDLEPDGASALALAAALDGLAVDGGWQTTRQNGLALLALGRRARASRVPAQPFAATLRVAGESPRGFTDRTPLAWNGRDLPGLPDVRIDNEGPGRCFYALSVDGVPLQPDTNEMDRGVCVRRTFRDRTGAAIDPVSVRVGDTVVVRIEVRSCEEGIENVVIEDLLPAGLEIENPAAGDTRDLAWIVSENPDEGRRKGWVRHAEVRDDRLLLFGGRLTAGSVYYYSARAVTPGRYVWPAIAAEAMYDPAVRSRQGGRTIEVTE